MGFRYIYGPVHSRRLGRSLGIDLVPFKTCTYDCVYCQLGRTTNKTTVRSEYVAIDAVEDEVGRRLASYGVPDYITLAGSGEPTLNTGIGSLIERIKRMTSAPVAVLTNGSLLWQPEVRDALMAADLVLPSLDAGDDRLFQYVNRPHPDIAFERMVDGIAEFTRRFTGEVWLEVLLLGGVTAVTSEVDKISALVGRIAPARVQLNTATRPPAEPYVFAVPRGQLERLAERLPGTVDMISEAGAGSEPPIAEHEAGDADILALLSRRPCTVHGVAAGLGMSPNAATKRLQALVRQGAVSIVRAEAGVFYAMAETTR